MISLPLQGRVFGALPNWATILRTLIFCTINLQIKIIFYIFVTDIKDIINHFNFQFMKKVLSYDKFLSEEFWEQVVYNYSLDGNGHISNLHRILTEDRIMKHLSMDFPGHKVVSNIFDIKEGDIVNGKKVVIK